MADAWPVLARDRPQIKALIDGDGKDQEIQLLANQRSIWSQRASS